MEAGTAVQIAATDGLKKSGGTLRGRRQGRAELGEQGAEEVQGGVALKGLVLPR
jgi:hypothetical protein